MRILQIEKYFWPKGGSSRYALQLSDLLRKEKHAVIPFASRHENDLSSPYTKYFVPAVDFADLKDTSLLAKLMAGLQILYSFRARRGLKRLLANERIDVAHIHNIYHQISPSILPVLKKKRIPVVMTLHDYKLLSPNYTLFHHGAVHEEDAQGWYWSCVKNKCFKDNRMFSALVTLEMIFHHKIRRYYERYVDVFIAPSVFIRELFIKYGWPADKIVHVPMPVELVPLPDQHPGDYVVYVGRLSEEKGVHVLLAAAELTPDISYVIIGTGPEEGRLAQQVKEKQLRNVQLVGYKQASELGHLVNHARLVVVPSIWYENSPLSVLEAKAAGKIVIASEIGGLPEFLPAELLVRPNDPAALAQKIDEWFQADESVRLAMGKQLREEVHEQNDPSTHAETILAIYTSLLSRN